MYGLVLEGGGAKGSYHIGVYKALKELNIPIGGIVGTSIGALNGALLVQGDYEKCLELWNRISYSMVVDVDDEDMDKLVSRKLVREDLSYFKGKLKDLISNRGFDIGPMKNLLDDYVDEEKIRQADMDFGMATINLTELKLLNVFLEDIPEGELVKYLLASAYLPVFKAEKIGGSRYLDGGFYDNLPYKMLLERGYKDLILVRTHAFGITKKIDLGESDSLIISPSGDLGRSFEYDSNRARSNIEMGYYDGLRAFKGLKGNSYYIKAKEEGDYYLDFLLGLEETKVGQMAEILKIGEGPYRRVLFEEIIPKLCSLLSLDEACDYEEILICLLEKKAEKLGIERYSLYDFEELLSLVEDKNIGRDEREPGVIDKIIERVDLTIFHREDIVLDLAEILF